MVKSRFDYAPLDNERQFFHLWAVHNAAHSPDPESFSLDKEANRLSHKFHPVSHLLTRSNYQDHSDIIRELHQKDMIGVKLPEEPIQDVVVRLSPYFDDKKRNG